MPRCGECSHVALERDDGSLPSVSCGVCRIGATGKHTEVGLAVVRECEKFALAAAEQIKAVAEASEKRVQAWARVPAVLAHVAAMRCIPRAEDRAAHLARVEQEQGADMRRDLEAAYLADWKARKAEQTA